MVTLRANGVLQKIHIRWPQENSTISHTLWKINGTYSRIDSFILIRILITNHRQKNLNKNYKSMIGKSIWINYIHEFVHRFKSNEYESKNQFGFSCGGHFTGKTELNSNKAINKNIYKYFKYVCTLWWYIAKVISLICMFEIHAKCSSTLVINNQRMSLNMNVL